MKHCKEIARLVSEGHDRHLSLVERMHIRMHMVLCFVCRRFTKQIDLIRGLSHSIGDTGHDTLDESLSPEAKARIKNALSQNP